MIPTPLSLLTSWFRTNPKNVWLIAGLVAVIAVLGGVYLKGRSDSHAKDEARRKVEVAAAMASAAKADVKAGDVVKAKAVVAAEQKEDLINAVAKAPDGIPDESSVRWGCEFVRQQTGRPSNSPACRAFDR